MISASAGLFQLVFTRAPAASASICSHHHALLSQHACAPARMACADGAHKLRDPGFFFMGVLLIQC
jgi:hypothetical protein